MDKQGGRMFKSRGKLLVVFIGMAFVVAAGLWRFWPQSQAVKSSGNHLARGQSSKSSGDARSIRTRAIHSDTVDAGAPADVGSSAGGAGGGPVLASTNMERTGSTNVRIPSYVGVLLEKYVQSEKNWPLNTNAVIRALEKAGLGEVPPEGFEQELRRVIERINRLEAEIKLASSVKPEQIEAKGKVIAAMERGDLDAAEEMVRKVATRPAAPTNLRLGP